MLKPIINHIKSLAYCVLIAIGLSLLASSCVYDAMESVQNQESDNPAEKYYLAIQIYDTADENMTRDGNAFDSDFDDENVKESDNIENVFNKGLKEEKAICDDYSAGIPNFILLFNSQGKKVGDIIQMKPLLNEDTKYPESENDPSQDGALKETPLYSNASLFVATFEDIINEDKVSLNEILRNDIKNVMVVLNANESLRKALSGDITLDEVKTLKMAKSDVNADNIDDATDFLYFNNGATKFFTMSSSMVVKDNEVSGKFVDAATRCNVKSEIKDGELVDHQYCTIKDHLYKTKAEARRKPFVMYVERAQSKYTVLFKKGNSEYYFDQQSATKKYDQIPVTSLTYEYSEEVQEFDPFDEYKSLNFVKEYERSSSISNRNSVTVETSKGWKVNINGWGLNGLEKNEYLFKNISPNATNATYFDGWQTSLLDYRNFWAEDINYGPGNYPDQCREVLGVVDGKLKTDNGVKNWQKSNSTLNYFTFKELSKKAPHQYSPENTFNASIFSTEALDSKEYLRTGTHIIVTAQLLIDGLDSKEAYNASSFNEDGLVKGAVSKLRMNGIYWSEDAYKEYVAEYLAYWMMIGDNITKFGSNDGNFYVKENDNYRLATGEDFELKAANIKGGDGWVYLSPVEEKILYTKSTEVEPKYKEISKTDYKILAYQHQDLMAAHFNEGRMYYAIPIRHNNPTSDINSLSAIKTGDFGAVRNHWYSFTVTAINSIGTPVDNPGDTPGDEPDDPDDPDNPDDPDDPNDPDDPEEPIIPNIEPKNPGLGVEVKILDWHKVNTDVDISNQRPNK